MLSQSDILKLNINLKLLISFKMAYFLFFIAKEDILKNYIYKKCKA